MDWSWRRARPLVAIAAEATREDVLHRVWPALDDRNQVVLGQWFPSGFFLATISTAVLIKRFDSFPLLEREVRQRALPPCPAALVKQPGHFRMRTSVLPHLVAETVAVFLIVSTLSLKSQVASGFIVRLFLRKNVLALHPLVGLFPLENVTTVGLIVRSLVVHNMLGISLV